MFQRFGLEGGQVARPPCLSSEHLDRVVARPFAKFGGPWPEWSLPGIRRCDGGDEGILPEIRGHVTVPCFVVVPRQSAAPSAMIVSARPCSRRPHRRSIL
jgi:hypothetical protein